MKQTNDRRSDTRLLCADLVQLIWRDSNGVERRRIGNLENISSDGLSFQLETTLPAGTHVRVLCGEVELAGHVCYVIFRDKAFFIGVQLDEASRWSASLFAPRHLLDPRTLKHYRPVIPIRERQEKWVN